MSLAIEEREESTLVSLEGTIDIACAAELKGLLVEALGRAKEVRVSIQKAMSLDVTTVQLLWASSREAKRLGLGFVLAEKMPEQISKVLGGVGIHELGVSAGIS